MKRNFKLVAFLVLAVLVCSGTLALTRARAERLKSHDLKPVAPEQSESTATNQSGKTYSQDLAKVLIRHDLVEFEPRRVAEQVRTTGRLTIPSSSGTFELTLAPHDLRASNYRSQVSLGGGEERA